MNVNGTKNRSKFKCDPSITSRCATNSLERSMWDFKKLSPRLPRSIQFAEKSEGITFITSLKSRLKWCQTAAKSQKSWLEFTPTATIKIRLVLYLWTCSKTKCTSMWKNSMKRLKSKGSQVSTRQIMTVRRSGGRLLTHGTILVMCITLCFRYSTWSRHQKITHPSSIQRVRSKALSSILVTLNFMMSTRQPSLTH